MADMLLKQGEEIYKVTDAYINQGGTVYKVLEKYQRIGDTVYKLFSALDTWLVYTCAVTYISEKYTDYEEISDEEWTYSVGFEGDKFIGEDDVARYLETFMDENQLTGFYKSYEFSEERGFYGIGETYSALHAVRESPNPVTPYLLSGTEVWKLTTVWAPTDPDNAGNDFIEFTLSKVARCTHIPAKYKYAKVDYLGKVYSDPGQLPTVYDSAGNEYVYTEGSIEDRYCVLYSEDDDAYYYYELMKGSRFTIGYAGAERMTFLFEEGMTWRDFVNSSYNNGKNKFEISDAGIIYYYDDYYGSCNVWEYKHPGPYQLAKPDDVIESTNKHYSLADDA